MLADERQRPGSPPHPKASASKDCQEIICNAVQVHHDCSSTHVVGANTQRCNAQAPVSGVHGSK